MAKENPTCGYDRIQGALANPRHEISDTTVGNILKAHGIEPAPERKRTTTWKTFIKAHLDVLPPSTLRRPSPGRRADQGLENKLINPGAEVAQSTSEIECRERRGGLLNYYYRRAA